MSKEMAETYGANSFLSYSIRKILGACVKISRYTGIEMSKNCPNT